MRMPKNKKELIEMLKLAFTAGCDWGYVVEHTVNVLEQERLGAMAYVGEISIEEATQKREELVNRIESR